MKMRRWQFSLRGLLLFTTIVSICMAVGVHFAGFMFALLAIGLTQAATLLAADWLIRPANRRALAYATACSWTVAGSGLFAIGASGLFTVDALFMTGDGVRGGSVMFAAGLIAAGVFCYFLAFKRWRQLTRPRQPDFY